MCWRRTERAHELEDAGHVQVAADPADGRSYLVTLTPAGAGELQRLTQAGLDRFALFVADWQPGDVRMLTALLDKLRNSIAAVAAQEQQLRPASRRWAGTSRRGSAGLTSGPQTASLRAHPARRDRTAVWVRHQKAMRTGRELRQIGGSRA
jgi:hypothetical protein